MITCLRRDTRVAESNDCSPLSTFLAGMIAACPVILIQAETLADSPIVAGTEVNKVADGFKFTEGPTADQAGNVYFTDQPNDRIVFYDFATGKTTDWMSPSGRSNGLYFAAADKLISCADANNELWSIDTTDKSKTVLVKDYQGARLGGPNDCWAAADGSIYFTDPLYKRPWWVEQPDADLPRGVYRLSPAGELSRVAKDFVQPNGIIGDDENGLLYVADIGDQKTFRFKIAADGSLTDRTLFCESGSDGMTIDVDRNLYLTGKGVMIFSPEGKQIDTIEVPAGWTANVTFAGPDFSQLFITASDAVYVVETKTKGLR